MLPEAASRPNCEEWSRPNRGLARPTPDLQHHTNASSEVGSSGSTSGNKHRAAPRSPSSRRPVLPPRKRPLLLHPSIPPPVDPPTTPFHTTPSLDHSAPPLSSVPQLPALPPSHQPPMCLQDLCAHLRLRSCVCSVWCGIAFALMRASEGAPRHGTSGGGDVDALEPARVLRERGCASVRLCIGVTAEGSAPEAPWKRGSGQAPSRDPSQGQLWAFLLEVCGVAGARVNHL